MKRLILIIAALPFCFGLAQNPHRPTGQQPAGFQPKQNRPDADMKKADLNADPAGDPSCELTVSEFQLKRNDLKGQVVELTFDKVVSLKQAGQGGYMAMVTYESPRLAEGLNIIVPQDGLKFFEELSKPEIRRKETVYIQVLNASVVKALGTRFRKNAEESERYRW